MFREEKLAAYTELQEKLEALLQVCGCCVCRRHRQAPPRLLLACFLSLSHTPHSTPPHLHSRHHCHHHR